MSAYIQIIRNEPTPFFPYPMSRSETQMTKRERNKLGTEIEKLRQQLYTYGVHTDTLNQCLLKAPIAMTERWRELDAAWIASL
jgi:hypothetical protein